MQRRTRRLGAVALATGILLVGCGDDDGDTTDAPSGQQTDDTTMTDDTGMTEDDGMTEDTGMTDDDMTDDGMTEDTGTTDDMGDDMGEGG